MTLASLLYFLAASIALTIAPGPDNTFVMATGISRGPRAAIITGLGMNAGIGIHTIAAALGVSAVLYSSAAAFTLLKYLGGAYLLFLAYRAMKEPAHSPDLQHGATALSPWKLFRRGFLMNIINPKVALFFLAFLPQFVSQGRGSITGQMLLFGAIFMIQGALIFSTIGYLSGSLGSILLRRPRVAQFLNWLSAGIFASLGIKLIFAKQ